MNILLKMSLLAVSFLVLYTACMTDKPKLSETEELDLAIRKNNVKMVSNWLRKGGDANKLIEGRSLLYIATGPKGGHEVIKHLVENGADVNLGMGKFTPLMNAASWANVKDVDFLLKNGADKNLRNDRGDRAIDLIGDCGDCPESGQVRQLLKE